MDGICEGVIAIQEAVVSPARSQLTSPMASARGCYLDAGAPSKMRRRWPHSPPTTYQYGPTSDQIAPTNRSITRLRACPQPHQIPRESQPEASVADEPHPTRQVCFAPSQVIASIAAPASKRTSCGTVGWRNGWGSHPSTVTRSDLLRHADTSQCDRKLGPLSSDPLARA